MINYRTFPTVFLAGRSSLTITNPATGQWIKVKMRQLKDRGTGLPGPAYYMKIALLDDSEAGYRFAGTYFSDSGRFKPGRDVLPSSRLGQVANFLVASVAKPLNLQTCAIDHEGRCCRCARPLTHPESIATGIGPDCAGRVQNRSLRPVLTQS